MNLDNLKALIQEQLPDAPEELLRTLAEKLSVEAGKEADRRATEASRTAVANYEKKHHLKDGRPEEAPTDAPAPSGDEAPAWARALIEANQDMRSELDGIKRERNASTRRNAFEGLLEGLPESLRSAYLRTPYADLSDEDFDKLTASVGEEVQGILADQKTRGIVTAPRTPSSTPPDSTASKEEVDAVMAGAKDFGKF